MAVIGAVYLQVVYEIVTGLPSYSSHQRQDLVHSGILQPFLTCDWDVCGGLGDLYEGVDKKES